MTTQLKLKGGWACWSRVYRNCSKAFV